MVGMSYFLFKTEPDAYSFDDFLRDKETVWDGVTNPTAVKNLREMPKGTKWIFYHTGDERTAVGTGTVVSGLRRPRRWRPSRPRSCSPTRRW
jgi:predicted RNA-binding protein with PUA-like domain